MKKKVGNACRTKSQISGSKSKGRSFERDCEESLKQVYPDVYMTHEKGYIQQYDLRCDEKSKFVVECKKHRNISWNKAKKFYRKLQSVAPRGYLAYLIFQSSRQPCLVMTGNTMTSDVMVIEFEDIFGEFIKHKPTRNKKEVIKDGFSRFK